MPFLGDMLVPWRVNFYQLFFALNLLDSLKPFVFGISEAMESTDTQVRILERGASSYRGDITPVTYENKVIYGEAPVAPFMTILTMPVSWRCAYI